MIFTGNTVICNSHSNGVQLSYSTVYFVGHTLFHNNSRRNGGAIQSTFGQNMTSFSGTTIFTNNTATGQAGGGAVYALDTNIILKGNVIFNSAKNGGAMRTTVTFAPRTTLNTSYNIATDYGGAIYHIDIPSREVCYEELSTLQYCFVQCGGCRIKTISINSYHDSAGKHGSFLYGGFLDRYKIKENTNFDRT